MVLNYKEAKQKLLMSDINGCQQFFANNNFVLELGYAELLNDNLKMAKELFASLQNKDVRAHWALIMISYIDGVPVEYPSYFMIRNFLEIDLNILINNYKGDYVEKIIRYSDYLFPINPEINKFIGRVFWNNDLKEQALFFLNRAKNYFYNDPELHYLLAVVFLERNDVQNAINALEDCLNVLPGYYPALDLLKKINKNII